MFKKYYISMTIGMVGILFIFFVLSKLGDRIHWLGYAIGLAIALFITIFSLLRAIFPKIPRKLIIHCSTETEKEWRKVIDELFARGYTYDAYDGVESCAFRGSWIDFDAVLIAGKKMAYARMSFSYCFCGVFIISAEKFLKIFTKRNKKNELSEV